MDVEKHIQTIKTQRGEAVDQAIRELYAKYRYFCYRLAKPYGYSNDEADAIGMYCVWRTALAYQAEASEYITYLGAAIKNELVTRYTPRVPQTDEEDSYERAAPELYTNERAEEEVAAIMAVATPFERRILAYYLLGHDGEEIAALLEVEPRAVYSSMRSLRAVLQTKYDRGATLEEQCQELIRQGLTVKEIALQLGISRKSVSTALYRAKSGNNAKYRKRQKQLREGK